MSTSDEAGERTEPAATDTRPAAPGVLQRGGRISWNVITAVAVAGVGMLFLNIVADVALRYLTGSGILGTTEMASNWWMTALILPGLAVAQRQRSQIQIDFLVDALPARLRRVVDTAGLLLVAAVSLLLAAMGLVEALEQMRLGEYAAVGNRPIWPARFILPAGFTAMAAAAVMTAINQWRGGTR